MNSAKERELRRKYLVNFRLCCAVEQRRWPPASANSASIRLLTDSLKCFSAGAASKRSRLRIALDQAAAKHRFDAPIFRSIFSFVQYLAWTLLKFRQARPATAAARSGFCRDIEERALDKLDTAPTRGVPKAAANMPAGTKIQNIKPLLSLPYEYSLFMHHSSECSRITYAVFIFGAQGVR